ncbi:hypothetical protein QBC39DRAFT_149037 [Podospora conica]|nr:hypothetical protein QBC39DRAFT_149037 [Schizothecium conicum]
MLNRAAILLAPHRHLPPFLLFFPWVSVRRHRPAGNQRRVPIGVLFRGRIVPTPRPSLKSGVVLTAFEDGSSGTAPMSSGVARSQFLPVCLVAYRWPTRPSLLFIPPGQCCSPKSLPGPSGRLNTGLFPRCWSSNPPPIEQTGPLEMRWGSPGTPFLAIHHQRHDHGQATPMTAVLVRPWETPKPPNPTFNTKPQPPNHSWRHFTVSYFLFSPPDIRVLPSRRQLNSEDRPGHRLHQRKHCNTGQEDYDYQARTHTSLRTCGLPRLPLCSTCGTSQRLTVSSLPRYRAIPNANQATRLNVISHVDQSHRPDGFA